jgi:hypothetical protein
LRIRSYGVFHRIYESMVLDMHPVFAYPRRSRVAPSKFAEWSDDGSDRPAATIRLSCSR